MRERILSCSELLCSSLMPLCMESCCRRDFRVLDFIFFTEEDLGLFELAPILLLRWWRGRREHLMLPSPQYITHFPAVSSTYTDRSVDISYVEKYWRIRLQRILINYFPVCYIFKGFFDDDKYIVGQHCVNTEI